MRRTAFLPVVVALALAAQGGGVPAAPTQTLTGTYVWNQGGDPNDLEAAFTPTGRQKWDVTFRFKLRRRVHAFTGTAEGDLNEGALKGTVLNEGRTFTFSGTRVYLEVPLMRIPTGVPNHLSESSVCTSRVAA